MEFLAFGALVAACYVAYRYFVPRDNGEWTPSWVRPEQPSTHRPEQDVVDDLGDEPSLYEYAELSFDLQVDPTPAVTPAKPVRAPRKKAPVKKKAPAKKSVTPAKKKAPAKKRPTSRASRPRR